jgi:hypothetical protein
MPEYRTGTSTIFLTPALLFTISNPTVTISFDIVLRACAHLDIAANNRLNKYMGETYQRIRRVASNVFSRIRQLQVAI